MLNQFHDILPGSSITLVYDDAARQYAEIRESAESLRDSALASLVNGRSAGAVPVNTIGFPRNEVASGAGGKPVYVEAPSYGIGRVTDAPDAVQVAQPDKKNIVLENAKLRATLTTTGRLVSLIEKSAGREAIAPGGEGNLFQMFDDRSTAWDAWDVDPF